MRGHRNPNTLDSPPQFAKYHVNSGVFDFENVVWESGKLHIHVRAGDTATPLTVKALGDTLPFWPLAATTHAFPGRPEDSPRRACGYLR